MIRERITQTLTRAGRYMSPTEVARALNLPAPRVDTAMRLMLRDGELVYVRGEYCTHRVARWQEFLGRAAREREEQQDARSRRREGRSRRRYDAAVVQEVHALHKSGRSMSDISRRLGVPLGTVSGWISRARVA